jgi:hypothetical protein
MRLISPTITENRVDECANNIASWPRDLRRTKSHTFAKMNFKFTPGKRDAPLKCQPPGESLARVQKRPVLKNREDFSKQILPDASHLLKAYDIRASEIGTAEF